MTRLRSRAAESDAAAPSDRRPVRRSSRQPAGAGGAAAAAPPAGAGGGPAAAPSAGAAGESTSGAIQEPMPRTRAAAPTSTRRTLTRARPARVPEALQSEARCTRQKPVPQSTTVASGGGPAKGMRGRTPQQPGKDTAGGQQASESRAMDRKVAEVSPSKMRRTVSTAADTGVRTESPRDSLTAIRTVPESPDPAVPAAATPRRQRLPRHITSTPCGPAAVSPPAADRCYGFLEEEEENSPLEALVSPVGIRRARAPPPASPLRDASNIQPSRFSASKLMRKRRPEVTTTVASQLMEPDITFHKPASRSYSRRRTTTSTQSTLGHSALSSEASVDTTSGVVRHRRHKKQDQEKMQADMERWAASMNSILSEVDDFELVVERA